MAVEAKRGCGPQETTGHLSLEEEKQLKTELTEALREIHKQKTEK